MQRKISLIKLAFLSSLVLSCTKPPDIPICLSLDEQRGYCIYTISDKEFYVDADRLFESKNWEQVKATSLILPASSWMELKKYILKMCKQSKSCMEDLKKIESKSSKLEGKK